MSFCFLPTTKRRCWLEILAFPECALHILSSLGSNPGILGKSGKIPPYSTSRAPAACYIPETRISTSELCTQVGHWWFSAQQLSEDTCPTSCTTKSGNRGHRELQRCSLRVQAHFPSTWSWLLHFQTAENQVSEQTNGNGWSSPRNPRMESFWGNISALVPAFKQTVVWQWPILYFSGELTLPWYSTERKRLLFVLIIYWYFMRKKENYIWE